MTPQTVWIRPNTGKVVMKEVPIPKGDKPRKGKTKYDAEFEKLLEFKTGIESTEAGFELLRRALQRFLIFRGLVETTGIRRLIDKRTRMITIWLEKKNEQ